jgi:F420H(2)-dependent quinone reductase
MKFGGGTAAPLAEPAIRTTPRDIWLEVGRKRIKVRAQTLEGREWAEVLGRIEVIAPPYTNYQQKTDREIPIVRLSREP